MRIYICQSDASESNPEKDMAILKLLFDILIWRKTLQRSWDTWLWSKFHREQEYRGVQPIRSSDQEWGAKTWGRLSNSSSLYEEEVVIGSKIRGFKWILATDSVAGTVQRNCSDECWTSDLFRAFGILWIDLIEVYLWFCTNVQWTRCVYKISGSMGRNEVLACPHFHMLKRTWETQ